LATNGIIQGGMFQKNSSISQEIFMDKKTLDGQITFFYYANLEAAVEFYQHLMGFELVEDQEWAKIYRVTGSSYLGIVTGEKGFFEPQQHNAVLITLLTQDVRDWYKRLQSKGVKLLTGIQEKRDIQVRCFFLEDPGGYTLEIQQFLRATQVKLFHTSD
jgi:predicted enzyme related to lactoylglutathione lyase